MNFLDWAWSEDGKYWLWLYLIIVPVIVFSVKPEAPARQRHFKLIFAAIFILISLYCLISGNCS